MYSKKRIPIFFIVQLHLVYPAKAEPCETYSICNTKNTSIDIYNTKNTTVV